MRGGARFDDAAELTRAPATSLETATVTAALPGAKEPMPNMASQYSPRGFKMLNLKSTATLASAAAILALSSVSFSTPASAANQQEIGRAHV